MGWGRGWNLSSRNNLFGSRRESLLSALIEAALLQAKISNALVVTLDRFAAVSSTTKSLLPQAPGRGVALVYFDAGGGHRAAMNALRSSLEAAGQLWKISCLNLQELLDETDFARKLTGLRVQDIYNLMLKKGWTLGAARLLPPLHGLIRLAHRRIVGLLERYWRETQPEIVVSMIPNFNRALSESVHHVLPSAPFVTILTDLADYPPHFWMEKESEYLICGTDRAVKQALEMGHPADHVYRASGMILNPAFYETSPVNRAKQRLALGLEAGRLTGLVMFGGQGSRSMLTIARELASRPNLQLIFICGHNQKLQARLRRIQLGMPVHIEGFTRQVQSYMQISDFFLGKAGPGSVSEALQMGLPVIIERNAWTLPQELFNADWVEENDFGIVIPSFRKIRGAVEKLVEPGVIERFRRNALALRNRAVFEIPAFLAEILEKAKGGSQARALPSRST